ncbi:hypothetical protein D1007_48330 [Hordeum vulgare]|nr:hypothetical protein D1007_48330 [Hordeum vulgare]
MWTKMLGLVAGNISAAMALIRGSAAASRCFSDSVGTVNPEALVGQIVGHADQEVFKTITSSYYLLAGSSWNHFSLKWRRGSSPRLGPWCSVGGLGTAATRD